MLLTLTISTFITSCSKDDDGFEYPMEQLYGRWNAKKIKVDEKWYDVTQYPYTRFGMSITFYQNGTFYGSGYFGNGSGTYKASGKTITTYIDDEIYATYKVVTLSSTTANLIMTMGDNSIEMIAEKQ